MDEPPSLQVAQILSGDNLLYLVITVALLIFAAIVSAAESAFFSLTAQEVEEYRKIRNPKAKIVASLLSNARLLLTVFSTWKYMLLILASIIFTVAISLSVGNIVVELLTLAIAFSIFAIGVPKIYGHSNRVKIVNGLAGLTSFLVKLSAPFVKTFLNLSIRIEKKLEELAEVNSVKELTQVLELAAADKDTTEDEKEILKGIVNFGTLTVADVMRPENEINSIDASLNFHDLLIYIKKSGYSRMPVYDESMEKIQGILYIKDLLPYLNETKKFAWQKLLRPAYFISGSKKIDLLLKDFQEKRVHMALALDEQGNVAGIITLEDIIEEIIGDIHDEYDEAGAYVKKVDDRTYLVDSKIPLSEFCRMLDVDPNVFEGAHEENDSLGTVLSETHPETPKKGGKIIMDPFTLTIESVDQKRIKKLKVQVHEHKERD